VASAKFVVYKADCSTKVKSRVAVLNAASHAYRLDDPRRCLKTTVDDRHATGNDRPDINQPRRK
jgi:hypothetical protein